MISNKLKRLRLENKYSQNQVAKRLGYTTGYSIYRKEKGKRSWSVNDIRELSKLYSITTDELLADEAVRGENDAKK
ncbi:TPA: helix-turn-helix transcriptional regulator [Clostridioides difficile]